MKISQAGIDLIKRYEGLRLKAYKCSAGVWTIGYGHTAGVKPGTTITRGQAEAMLTADLVEFECYVNQLVKVPLKQYQFDALVSFCFNVGPDIDADTIAEGLGDSSLLRKLNRGDYAGAADEFSKWVKASGQVQPGLVKRRESERTLFLGIQ